MENNNKPKQQNQPPKNDHKKEKLSREDLEDLMGMNMQVLRKKNGAWRRR